MLVTVKIHVHADASLREPPRNLQRTRGVSPPLRSIAHELVFKYQKNIRVETFILCTHPEFAGFFIYTYNSSLFFFFPNPSSTLYPPPDEIRSRWRIARAREPRFF